MRYLWPPLSPPVGGGINTLSAEKNPSVETINIPTLPLQEGDEDAPSIKETQNAEESPSVETINIPTLPLLQEGLGEVNKKKHITNSFLQT